VVKRHLCRLAVLGVLAIPAHQASAADVGVRVIVHPQVKGSLISRTDLTQIFLGKSPRWGDGARALPVDQSIRSEVRSAFSRRLLGQPIVEVQVYWHRKMSEGKVPPPVKSSDEDVVAFVAQTPGAIGYVSSAVALPDTVRAIEVAN
jgi:ABC-type phosphate transport system substrate-binding protein